MDIGVDINNVNYKNPEYLFLLEQSDQPMTSSKKNKYVLEGICAKFNIKNHNNRVYERDEYLPHLDYLNEEVQGNRLVGELDHPQSFDINYRNASHIIENIWYDENTDSVKLRIRLMNTPSGRIAQELVDEGVPISISSRAAGEVLNEGKVKLHRIFTYDIVARGGFGKDATMQTVSESENNNKFKQINENLDSIKQQSVINKLEDVSENIGNGNIKAYRITEDKDKFKQHFIKNETEKNNKTSMSEQITMDQIEKYINEKVLERIANLENQIQNLSESSNSKQNKNNIKISEKEVNEKIKNGSIGEYLNQLSEQVNNLTNYIDIEIKEKLDNNIKYSEKIGETVNNLGKYTDFISAYLDESIQFADKIAEVYEGKFDALVKFTNYLSENQDKTIQHNDHLKETINNNIDFSNFLAENVDKGLQFADQLGQSIYENIEYTKYISEGLNATVFANSNEYIEYEDIKENKNTDKYHMVNESYKHNADKNTDNGSSAKQINEKVDQIINNFKTDNTDQVIEQRHPFLQILNEEDKKYFRELDNETKKQVAEALNHTPWFSREDVMEVMGQIVEHQDQNTPNYIKFMPDDIKPLYNQLSESEAQSIHAQAQLYKDLNTPYQVKHFWYSRDLTGARQRLNEQQKANDINKSENIANKGQSKEGQSINESNDGYNDYIQKIRGLAPKNRG